MRLLRSFLTASATTRSSDASPRPSPQPNAEDMKDTRTLGSDSSTSIKPTLKVVVPPRKFFDAVEAQDTKISFGQKIMAVANKKFAGLPDLDLETYIYETPDLTDDASTVQTATIRTASPTPSNGSLDKEDIDRTNLNQNHARTRFERSRVDANDVNFSDSLASTGRSYKVSHRRRRKRRDGLEEIGDLTDSDEEEEGLLAKLARLRREAEEVRAELERRKATRNPEEKDGINGQKPELEDGVTELSRLLDGLYSMSNGETSQTAAEAELSQQLARPIKREPPKEQSRAVASPLTESQISPPATPSPETLNAISEISNRLTSLEDALGLQSVSTISPSTPLAILPTLASLSSQVSTLTSTLSLSVTNSTTSSSTGPSSNHPAIEALSQRIRALTTESNNLVQSRTRAAEAATQLAEARASASVNAAPPPPQKTADPGTDIDDNVSQIRALYRLLPTVESLAPLLPIVLDRLRALRDVHAGAADVKGELEAVREAQGRLEREVDRWEEVLNGVEEKCEDGEKGMKENLEVVEGWVRGLEDKVGQLG